MNRFWRYSPAQAATQQGDTGNSGLLRQIHSLQNSTVSCLESCL